MATTAISMPAAESRLPRRAVAGWFIRCSPSTKQVAAVRYAEPDDDLDAWS